MASSTPPRSRFGFMVPFAFALVAAMSVAGCEGDSKKNVEKPTPAVSRLTAKAITPLGEGEFIAFERQVSEDEDPELYAVAPDGGKPRLLMKSAGFPHWSPDGSTLAFGGCLNAPTAPMEWH